MTTKQFNKLSKARKAVLVAEDVLLQIKAKKYVPKTDKYIAIIGEYFYTRELNSRDIKTNFDIIPPCQVCALGSMLLSCTHLGNLLTFDDIIINGSGMRDINNDNVKKLFKSIFDDKTLTLIETCFENTEKFNTIGIDNFGKDVLDVELSEEELQKCYIFYSKYKTDQTRLIGICNNIIKNNGVFIP